MYKINAYEKDNIALMALAGIAVVDNLDNALNGGNGDAYTMTGISVTAEAELIPEPTTATLSLLALAGLAVRRRRK